MANQKKIPNPFEGLDNAGDAPAQSPAARSAPNPFDGLDDAPSAPSGYGIGDFARDVGVTAAKGVIGVGEAAVGIANIPTLGRAGKALASVGFDPKAAKAELDSYRSDALNQQQREVDSVDGFTDTAKAYLSNPGALAAAAGESVPSMLGGGAVARGVLKVAPRLGTGIAAGIGEGAVSGGQTAEQIRQESASGDLTLGQTAIAAGSGALTGALGAAAGKVAKRLGIADVDELIAGGTPIAGATNKSAVRKIAEGTLTEGVIEELPQSSQEQVAQNLALGRPWDEGVGKAAAAGAIIGGVMGGGGNAVQSIRSGRDAAPVVEDPATPSPQNPGENQPAPGTPVQSQEPAPVLDLLSDDDTIPDADPLLVAEAIPATPAAPLVMDEAVVPDAVLAAPTPPAAAPRAMEEELDLFGESHAAAVPAALPPAAAPAAPLASNLVQVNGKSFDLTPEQAQAWDAADTNHARTLAGLNPQIYSGSVIAKAKKAAGMQLSAQRRQITGALTEKEQRAVEVDAARVRPGDTVQARVGDRDVAGTAENLRYGNVRINTPEGIVEVPRSDVSKPQAAPAPVAPAPAVQAIPPNVQAGSSVDPASGKMTIANSVAGTSVTLDPTSGPMSAAVITGELANGSISRAQEQAAATVAQEQAAATVAQEQAAAQPVAPVYGQDPLADYAAVMGLAASKEGTLALISRLVESGANLNAINEAGRTPLTSLIEDGDVKSAARVMQAGADLEAVDGRGFTPLQLALATSNPTLASALVRQGASLDRVVSMARRDAEGNLPKAVQSLVDQAAMRDMFTPGAKQEQAPAAPAAAETSKQSTGSDPVAVPADRQTQTRDELAARIESIFNGAKPGLGTDLLKLSDFSLESAAEIGGIGPRTYGVTETQAGKSKVRIPFDNIPPDWSDERVKGLILHEVAVHAAQLGKSLPAFAAIQQQILNMIRAGDAKALAAFNKVPADTDPRFVGEEILAYYIEMNPKSSTADKVVEWFRQALRSMTKGMKLAETGRFNKWVNELTHAELLAMATDSLVQHVENSAKRDGEALSSKIEGDRLFSEGPSDPAPTVGDPKAELSRGTKTKIKYVDKFATMRKLVRDVEKALGSKIPDKVNPSLAQDKAASLAGEQSRKLDEKHVDPMLKFLREKKISLDTLSDYMQARHAPERNAEMKRINPSRANNESLSGMSNLQAAQILGVDIAGMSVASAKARLDALHPDLQKAAGMVEAIIADNRARTVAAGIETKETVDKWDGKYDFYVPLKREGFDDVLKGNGRRNGTAGSLTQEASGSDAPVENVVAHAILDAKKTINRAAENDALKVMAAFTKKYLDKSTARLIKPTLVTGDITTPEAGDTTTYGLPQKTVFTTDGDGNIIEARLQDDPFYSDKPNFVAYRVAGKDYAIEFNQDSPVARSIAAAYTKANDIKTDSEIVKTIGKITRYISQINTSLNPFFGIKNIIRDTGHASIAIANTPIAGKQAQLLKNQALGTKAVFAELAGARPGVGASQALRDQFNEFRALGGKMEFSSIYANAEDQVTALNKKLDKDWFLDNAVGRGLGKAKLDGLSSAAVDKIVRPLASGLEIWNEALENGTRFAIYKTAVDNGVSKAQAISLAQNLTVNFGRKGTDTAVLSNFYGFFNAAVQGTTSVGRTIFDTDKAGPYGMPFSLTPAGKKILVGGILAGIAQAALMAAAGFEDDEIKENDATKNVLIPIGDKKYLRIPMPQGYSVLPTIGRQLFNAMVYGKPLDRVAKTIEATTDGFNPIGSGGTISQTLAPTFLDPFVQLTENKDFAGNQIARKDMSGNNPTPGYTRSKDSATAFSKWASQALNNLTGGTDYKPGAVSPTPDEIDFMLGTIGGGLFRESMKFANAGESIKTGEDLDPSRAPLVSGYYSNADSNGAVSGRYYDSLKVINAHKLEVEGRKKNQGDVAGYYSDFPEARLIPFAQNVEGQVSKLSAARKKATARGDRERVKELGNQIATAQRRLIDRFKEERQ